MHPVLVEQYCICACTPLWLNDLGLPESKQPFKGALSTLSSANQGVAILSLLGAEAENRNMYIFSSVWVWETGNKAFTLFIHIGMKLALQILTMVFTYLIFCELYSSSSSKIYQGESGILHVIY